MSESSKILKDELQKDGDKMVVGSSGGCCSERTLGLLGATNQDHLRGGSDAAISRAERQQHIGGGPTADRWETATSRSLSQCRGSTFVIKNHAG